MRTPMSLTLLLTVVLGCSADTVTDPPIDVTPHSGFYVSVDGSPTDSGTRAHPWDLAHALAHPSEVQPGDTIWLLGGTYKGNFTSTLTGAPGAPIVLRQYPGEHATIDGDFEATGSYAWYWGFEVMFSDPMRVSAIPGSDPTDLPRYGKAIGSKGSGSFNKFINLVVHDMANGLGDNSTAHGTELYGNIVYNNGWIGPDRGHGHGVYSHNQFETKRIAGNIVFNNFDIGMQFGGTDAAVIMNLMLEGNTVFANGAPNPFGWQVNVAVYGGGQNLGNIVFRKNSFFHISSNLTSLSFGRFQLDVPNYPLTFEENRVQGMTWFNEWKQLTVRDNRFTTGAEPLVSGSTLVSARLPLGTTTAAYQWDGNTYASAPSPIGVLHARVNGVGAGYTDLGTWRTATGWDGASTLSRPEVLSVDVVVRPNEYEPGRAFVTVWNSAGASTARANVSSVLRTGDSYIVHHVYDVYGDSVTSGVYAGGDISIPLQSYTPPVPIGLSTVPPSTGIRFNVFLIEKR